MRILLLFLFGCTIACTDVNRTSTATDDPRFHTDDASELFFRNTRQNKYLELPQLTEGQDVFRFYQLRESKSNPQIYGLIVLNWLEDEAYFFVETNDYPQDFKKPLTVVTATGKELILTDYAPAAQLEFGESLARWLNQNEELSVISGTGATIRVFRDRDERTAFLTALGDFLRLTK